MTEFKNYICIDGKKAELTLDQLKALGIELKKSSPFDRVREKRLFYFICADGNVSESAEYYGASENSLYSCGNYCTDKSIIEQRALHETLNRLLWRYSMEHDGDKIDWNDASAKKYYIYYHHGDNTFNIKHCWKQIDLGTVFFYTIETARNAIEEVVKPFMEAHPNFKW